MKWILRKRPAPGTVLGLAALVVAIGGAAFAAIPDSSGTIHGCYDRRGDLRVVESAADCRRRETAIEWNQQGPPGPPGAGAVQTALVRLSVGETKPILRHAPFTLTAECGTVDASGTRVNVHVRSDEAGWIRRQGAPLPADTDFDLFPDLVSKQEDWHAGGDVNLIAPSGAHVTTVTSEGVNTLGSDCAVAAMIIG